MAGIAAEVLPKIALNWAMIKAAPEQGRAVLGKPATANTNLALAIRAINTLAPAPVTPAAPALPVAVSIPNAIVQVIIVGMVAVVLFLVHQVINTPAPAPATPVAPALPVAANIPLAPAPLAMSGKMVVAGNKHYYCNGKVVGVRATGMGFYVAMKDLGYMTWSNANRQCRNYSFCGNVKGTLPTREQLLSIYQNKSRVNSLLSTNGGTKMTEGRYWSSTHRGSNDYYIVGMSNGNVSHGYDNNLGNYDSYVRPVLASW